MNKRPQPISWLAIRENPKKFPASDFSGLNRIRADADDLPNPFWRFRPDCIASPILPRHKRTFIGLQSYQTLVEIVRKAVKIRQHYNFMVTSIVADN